MLQRIVFICFFLVNFEVYAQETKLDSLIRVLETAKEDTNKVKVLYRISDMLRSKYQYEKAMEYTQKSLQLSQKLDFKKYIANNYGVLGIIYTNLGNYNESLAYHQRSLAIKEKLSDKQGISNSYNNIGDVYYQLSNYSEALVYHFKALKLREDLGNKTSIANSYNNIGSVYNAQNNYEESLKYHLLSLQIREQNKDKIGMGMSYNNMAINYNALGKHQEAIEYHQKALALHQENNNKRGSAITLGNMGNIYYYLKDYGKAADYYKKSLQIREEIKDKRGVAVILHNLANICMKEGKYQEAKEYLDKNFALNKEMQSLDELKNTYFVYTNLYTEEGKYQEALTAYKNYILYRDSIFNTENDKKSLKAQIQYEFDKQQAINQAELEKQQAIRQAEFEKQNILNQSRLQQQEFLLDKQEQSYLILEQSDKLKALNLKKSALELKQNQDEKKAIQIAAKKDAERNELIILFTGGIAFLMLLVLFVIVQSLLVNKKKNAIIAQNLEEKEILLKEIHHRVKNNLQVISSLLNIQSRYIKDETALEALKESKERIHAISLLHTEIYQNEVLKLIDSKSYLTNLVGHIQNTFDGQKKTKIEVSIDKILLDIDVLIPLGLIVNELITNAFKYGCTAQEPQILVTLTQNKAQEIILRIQDNGQGFPVDFKAESSSSLGFKLVSMFAKKLQAQTHFTNENGALVTLTFKSA